MFLRIIESAHHEQYIAHGLSLMTSSLHGWMAFPMPRTLTIDATSPGCHSGVPFVPIMFRAFLMERCATFIVKSYFVANVKIKPNYNILFYSQIWMMIFLSFYFSFYFNVYIYIEIMLYVSFEIKISTSPLPSVDIQKIPCSLLYMKIPQRKIHFLCTPLHPSSFC